MILDYGYRLHPGYGTTVLTNLVYRKNKIFLCNAYIMHIITYYNYFYMPELPEVETIKNGLAPYVKGLKIGNVVSRCYKLRWPIPENLHDLIVNKTILDVTRRGKYLLFHFDVGALIVHLGMSGRLCLLTNYTPPQRHDHVDIIFNDNCMLRYTDPRRFGAILVTAENPHDYPLLKNLGVEPLTNQLTAEYLMKCASKRKVAVKQFIMDGKIVVGVGNIYAAEALFLAGIHPLTPAGLLNINQWENLIDVIKQVLAKAIAAGGTTLKDFVDGFGKPGYFVQKLNVYGRAGQSCFICNNILQSCVLGQRSTVFCECCQV